jgi:hypothetical protein
VERDDPNRGTDKEGPCEGGWAGPQMVLTHRAPADPPEGRTVASDLATAVDPAAPAAGDRYVDVLADGTRLSSSPGGREIRWERTPVTEMAHATGLWFRVVR